METGKGCKIMDDAGWSGVGGEGDEGKWLAKGLK